MLSPHRHNIHFQLLPVDAQHHRSQAHSTENSHSVFRVMRILIALFACLHISSAALAQLPEAKALYDRGHGLKQTGVLVEATFFLPKRWPSILTTPMHITNVA